MRSEEPTVATQLFAAAMRDPARRAELEQAFAKFEARTAPIEDPGYSAFDPKGSTITFRNNTTGETIEVPDTPAARALADRKSLPRAQRRKQEAGVRRLLKKSRRALLKPA